MSDTSIIYIVINSSHIVTSVTLCYITTYFASYIPSSLSELMHPANLNRCYFNLLHVFLSLHTSPYLAVYACMMAALCVLWSKRELAVHILAL